MSGEQQSTNVSSYFEQLAETIAEYEATYLLFSELRDINFGVVLRKNIADVFYFLQPEIKLFWQKNNDLVAVYKKNTHDTLLSCLVKIRFLLSNDKILKEIFEEYEECSNDAHLQSVKYGKPLYATMKINLIKNKKLNKYIEFHWCVK